MAVDRDPSAGDPPLNDRARRRRDVVKMPADDDIKPPAGIPAIRLQIPVWRLVLLNFRRLGSVFM